MRFKDKVAVITGASRGIGAAIARRLGSEGARVVLGYHAQEIEAQNVVRHVIEEGGFAECTRVDVRDSAAVHGLIQGAVARHGRIDIVVANAGVVRDNLVGAMDDDEWAEVLDVNAGGAFRTVRAALKPMLTQRSGSVVFVSSVAAQKGGRGQANYAASKAAIEGFARSLAVEVARKQVRVNVVAPGLIETDMSADVLRLGREEALSKILLGRPGTADDVAHAVAFLASDEAAYITGTVLAVDGGFKMG